MKNRILLLAPFLFAIGCGGTEAVEVSDAVVEADTVGVEAMSEERLEELLSRLTLQLRDSISGDFAKGSRLHLWRFTTRLRRGVLSDLQEQRVVGFLEGLMAAQPEAAEGVEPYLFMAQNLLIGDVAPNIVGTDFDGVEFQLTDFLGLDHKGAIRFVGRRHEDTQVAVQYLLDEMALEAETN